MNFLECGLAFLEGFGLVVSPCILPILPILLSSSIDGSKSRPIGTILGFVFSFSTFAVLSRSLLTSLGIDVEIIRSLSLILLFAMGVVLVFTYLSDKFSELTQGLASLANTLSPKVTGKKEGFFSGLIIGALIGLIWTPCAGPILAAVIIQAVSQKSDLVGFLTILCFTTGAALPMFFMALFGRAVIEKFDFFKRNNQLVRRIVGFAIIGGVTFTTLGGAVKLSDMPAQRIREQFQSQFSDGLVDGIDKPYSAPEIEGIESWLNTSPLTLKDLKGKVVLIDFWTYSCINCVRTLPYITDWDHKYRDRGLVIIGVHAPEFAFEKQRSNVEKALQEQDIKYAVALDNDFKTWRNFNNRFWPAHYLIDKDGKVVYEHFGEGKYQVTENNIRYLLGLNKIKKSEEKNNLQKTAAGFGQTPELYLGTGRLTNFASPDQVKQGLKANYSIKGDLPLHHWGLEGEWRFVEEHVENIGSNALVRLHFRASKVYAVISTRDNQPHKVLIRVEGGDTKEITVQDQTVYTLVDLKEPKDRELEIKAQEPGVNFYTFAFGS
ncbi:MAG: cytochrome c biogenesis protein DipZ [Candidatus Caenarcaniphilales bacterium]|nr:cytochrome c biogenesis protein DipZ [Candidatus Caenarcaniphilales bacterium]